MTKKSKKKKDPGRRKFRKPITIDKDAQATFWTPEMERKVIEEREKRNPFPKGFTIDGEDSLAVYHTPEMEKKIKEERSSGS